jgi:hypothetical protein
MNKAWDETRKPITVWDLDNCLSDDGWRIKFIDWGAPDPWTKYRMYHTLCGSDAAGNVELFKHWLAMGAKPVFCTARPEVCRSITQVWINTHLGQAMRDHGHRTMPLYMRANSDHRPSRELKHSQVLHMLADHNAEPGNVVAAFDDHPEVLEMYRLHLGLPTQLVSIHEFSAYERPKS